MIVSTTLCRNSITKSGATINKEIYIYTLFQFFNQFQFGWPESSRWRSESRDSIAVTRISLAKV